MKPLLPICRLLRLLNRFPVKPSPPVSFSTSSYLCSQKKKSSYEAVDQAKYCRLVRSVLSRGPVQTPESLFKEDDVLYGPVSKCKVPEQEQQARVPQHWFPIFNEEKNGKPHTNGSSSPLKIPLQRNMIPSVTRILQHTMPSEQSFFLERWKQRMVLELGEDGFAEYTSNVFLQGKQFHEALESILSPQENLKGGEEHPQCGYIKSVQHILKEIGSVQALESAVQHEALQYVGLLDCVAEYQGKLCVIDWKTSEKPKPFIQNTYDNPLQVVAYMGAVNHDANYSFQVQCGLIVVAYKDGSPAHPHFMDEELCSKYWAKWLLRLEEYTEKQKNQSIPKPE
ncbi:similar to RIKEN cDNA 8430406I07, isoform CRA_a [Rattus norvegicus]|uniref:Mitochondrial genome maintenance exonuclease 1 n=3 Tax=Rattus norvegicus TaxID=10116 RepID=A6K748_RAT|nr:mitochondrial genome maintenance exonuclease 1 [Rattus norvegicus]XP_006235182.1 mitochondrial genome maintenance exonuclease 1 isoform X1 [Rattus norvegicus]XP_006235183.1 mitochondrial genome maintenance exonuclease 1 isoform X1 [Rattus norvegicus]XP_006235184.1 mitochondrial genome maintenance exonuclease 1 isoform X1 [Rattus norvegicus]XP_006235185.1 mitochondrial genome maintenance exonuclease 1 isoform X1 [Rattus norvegicus]AAH87676.1 Similar to RIKEN cDNA 8430406I07 [Rattus norvegicu|eukprot:NP_001009655.1 mitochondrial genome maintenance exonuclease 1 [Rattus norvegicus]